MPHYITTTYFGMVLWKCSSCSCSLSVSNVISCMWTVFVTCAAYVFVVYALSELMHWRMASNSYYNTPQSFLQNAHELSHNYSQNKVCFQITSWLLMAVMSVTLSCYSTRLGEEERKKLKKKMNTFDFQLNTYIKSTCAICLGVHVVSR